MPNYRRRRAEGGCYFLTLVTHERRPLFQAAPARRMLHQAISAVRSDRPFELAAMVLLYDHLHMLWRLPDGDADYSVRMSQIKKRFTHAYLADGGHEGATTASRRQHRIRGVWEKRFWEHTIKDWRDFVIHLEYIHLNPVKHGLVAKPIDWPWSSFRRYVKMGWYDVDWCGSLHIPGTEYIEPC